MTKKKWNNFNESVRHNVTFYIVCLNFVGTPESEGSPQSVDGGGVDDRLRGCHVGGYAPGLPRGNWLNYFFNCLTEMQGDQNNAAS